MIDPNLARRSSAAPQISPRRKAANLKLLPALQAKQPIPPQARDLELWGGVECTVNRVGDAYINQMKCSGHMFRPRDLELFADLGIRALRYPVLWELCAPEVGQTPDFDWAEERLDAIRKLGIRPIVGLVHHGSGPLHTSLVDPQFPEGLAQYARAVAEKFPWVEAYTPVNEPLTTARFSGMYGHWYPHGRDALTFAKALLIECRATVLAMREIRKVNPHAQLIQTDDMGEMYSTPRLEYQADFENERRWLTFDLLCGRMNRQHPMWGFLRWVGIEEAELAWFEANFCPPDVIGVNHYLTSNRYLDENIDLYPACTHGDNGRDKYADVEAVRVPLEGTADAKEILRQTWERYHLPVAITEAHLGCTREEQMRWVHEVWQGAQELKRNGVDVRAVTSWALLGSYHWNTMVTCEEGLYEPGAFDMSGGQPRRTAIARVLSDISKMGYSNHPVLQTPGWWRRADRVLYPHVQRTSQQLPWPIEKLAAAAAPRKSSPRPLLIVGGTGTLGRSFRALCDLRGLPYYALSRRELDIRNAAQVDAIVHEIQPWAVINATGYVQIDDAELNQGACFSINTEGALNLARACAATGAGLLSFSSDMVFDGGNNRPYVEGDPVGPLSVYGRSKAQMEKRVLEALPTALIARTGSFFGPQDDSSFITRALRNIARGRRVVAAEDVWVSPTHVDDLVQASLNLLIDGEHGVWHLANCGETTWANFAREAASLTAHNRDLVCGCSYQDLKWVAPRPVRSALSSERACLLPDFEDALHRYAKDVQL